MLVECVVYEVMSRDFIPSVCSCWTPSEPLSSNQSRAEDLLRRPHSKPTRHRGELFQLRHFSTPLGGDYTDVYRCSSVNEVSLSSQVTCTVFVKTSIRCTAFDLLGSCYLMSDTQLYLCIVRGIPYNLKISNSLDFIHIHGNTFYDVDF